MKKSIAKNYLYNMTYQVIAIILPIITTPYLSRVLGPEKIGIYSFIMSITTYFVLLGSLGINLYGSREIAYCQDNKTGYTRKFVEIFLLKVFTMSISLMLFVLIFVIRKNEYNIYYLILLFELIANTLDVSWFFQGLEEFKKTVMRSLIIKLLSAIAIFVFVKSQNDLIIYFMIYVISAFIGNISLWIYLPKYLDRKAMKNLKIFSHLKPMIELFIPQIALQVSTVLDKTMLGYFYSDKVEVGYYEQSQKIIRILITVVSALGIVIMPRIANSFAKKKNKDVEKYIKKSMNATIMISFPLIFGISVVSNNFVPVFFGDGYGKVIILLCILSPVLIMMGLSENIGKQYLLPTKQQKAFTLSVLAGFGLNLIINFCCIPKYGAIGASIASVIAEGIVVVIQLGILKKQVSLNYLKNFLFKYLMFSLLMFFGCYLINFLPFSNVISLFAKIVIGGLVYFTCLIFSKDEMLFELLGKIKKGDKNESE